MPAPMWHAQGVARVEIARVSVVELGLGILCILYAEQLVGAVAALLSHESGDGVEQVACGLGLHAQRADEGLYGEGIDRGSGYAAVGAVEGVAQAHDKVVLVAVAQQRIVGGYLVEEADGGARQAHHVHVYEVEGVAQLEILHALLPFVFPSGAEDQAGVLGALLIVERHGELGGCPHLLLEAAAQQRKLELGEGDAHLGGNLGVAVVDESVEVAADALVGRAELGRELLGAVAEVAVLVGEAHTHAEVALAIGAVKLYADALLAVASEADDGVEPLLAVDDGARLHVDVDAAQDGQLGQGLVGAVDGAGAVGLSRHDVALLLKYGGAQVAVGAVDHADVAVAHGVERCAWAGVGGGEEGDGGYAVVLRALHGRGCGGSSRRVDAQRQAYVVAAGHGVGHEVDVLLGEGVVAVVAQHLGDARALLVEEVAVEGSAGGYAAGGGVGEDDAAQGRVFDFVGQRGYVVGLAGAYAVDHVDFAPAGAHDGVGLDLDVHVAAVEQGRAQLAHGGVGELPVVDDGWLAYAAHPAVEPLGAVASREVVGGQLQLGEAEHLVVGRLAQEVVELFVVHLVAVALHVDVDLAQQHLPLGHMPGAAARAQQEGACDGTKPYFQRVCHSISLR